MAKKISIVTPSYNQAAFLERTILSVINQNYPNLEYIIIDGGSTDGSVDIIKKYEKHLVYWESSKDQGQYYAIQKGFEKCTGEIMAWLNSDDIYHSNSLFIVDEIFSNFPEVNWLTGNVSFIDEMDRGIRSYNSNRWSKYSLLKGEYVWIQQESTFWKRSLWDKVGGSLNLEVKLAADFELWTRFFRTENLFTIEALLGAFRIRKNGQKTLEQMSDYMMEYHAIMKNEKVSGHDKGVLRKIKLYEMILNRIPVVKRMKVVKNGYNKAIGLSPVISFNRNKYRYEFKTSEC